MGDDEQVSGHRIIGTLRATDGKGVVRIEDRFDTTAAHGRARPRARHGCARRRQRAPAVRHQWIAGAAVTAGGGNLPAAWNGGFVDAVLSATRIRPAAWTAAAAELDRAAQPAFVSCSCQAPSSVRSVGGTPSIRHSRVSPSGRSSAVTCCRSGARRRWTCCTRSTTVSRRDRRAGVSLPLPDCSAPTRSGHRTTSVRPLPQPPAGAHRVVVHHRQRHRARRTDHLR